MKVDRPYIVGRRMKVYIYVYIYISVCPLFGGLNPTKEGPFHSKQGSFGF